MLINKLQKQHFILLIVVLIGTVLRFYQIDEWSIWVDESWSMKFADLSFTDYFTNKYGDVHPPFYYILLDLWMLLFGSSEAAIRSFSAVSGSFSIVMIYCVGCLLFSKATGLVSAVLLALAAFHIQYAQNARMYELLSLLAILSYYFLIKLTMKPDIKSSAGYVIFTTLLVYTHFAGLFLIIAQNVYVFTKFLARTKNIGINLKAWLLLQLAVAVLYSPWADYLLGILSSIQGNVDFDNPAPKLRDVLTTFSIYAGTNKLLLLFVLVLPLSLFSIKKIAGSINLRNFESSIRDYCWLVSLTNVSRIWLLMTWLLIPIIIPWVVSQFSATIYYERTLIGSSLAFYLLVAYAITNIKTNLLILAVVVTIILLSVPSLKSYYNTDINREPWRDVARYVDANAKPDDMVIFHTPERGVVLRSFGYYSQNAELIKNSFPENSAMVSERNINKLRTILQNRGRVWLVLVHYKGSDPEGLIKTSLAKDYGIIDQLKFGRIEVYLFEKE